MGKSATIDTYFKRKNSESLSSSTPNFELSNIETPSLKSPRIENKEVVKEDDLASLERDPALRPPIWKFPINQQDEIRRAYLKLGPFQCKLQNYPFSGLEKNRRHFCSSWFDLFPSWLEYSPTKDAAFCLPCYLFSKPGGNGRFGLSTFVVEEFRSWKKVNDGENCAFLRHVRKNIISMHKNDVRSCSDLMNQSQHIEILVERLTSQQIAGNRLRLQVSMDVTRWLALQGCAFRGHDKNLDSLNRGNFLEMIKFLASYNQEIALVVLEKAPQNASYSSPRIQKEILHVFSQKVKDTIREEMSNAKFCLIIDETSDVSKKEHMAIVLRFVDKDGFIRERFFGLVHVEDTRAKTLKQGLCNSLRHHNLDVQNIRGQVELAICEVGTLHRVGATRWSSHYNSICSLFQMFKATCEALDNISNEGKTASHRGDADNAYSSLTSFDFVIILHLMKEIMGITEVLCQALQLKKHGIDIADMSAKYIGRRGCARNEQELWGILKGLELAWGTGARRVELECDSEIALSTIQEGSNNHRNSQVVSRIHKWLAEDWDVRWVHTFRENNRCAHWFASRHFENDNNLIVYHYPPSPLLELLLQDASVDLLSSRVVKHGIDIADMSAKYIGRRGCARNEQGDFSTEKFYRVNIFCATIDYQLQELNIRFNDNTVELLTLSRTLDPRNKYKSFNSDDICKLADKFYSRDFTEQEKLHLKMELQHFDLDIPKHPDLINLSTTSELCQGLARTGKSNIYPLIDRVIRLHSIDKANSHPLAFFGT
ncbi:uncharacterized protein LOC133312978 [Gastrolobium bilobum]|uniref:uncharacterized protein LOC133312978 n=1 Tax=Gastrolobium bilobum TaxID=150636 RepID=UPI002AAF2D1B|nr:uncharacterized protein LOC133312978 [Gastrolobium bilobum]